MEIRTHFNPSVSPYSFISPSVLSLSHTGITIGLPISPTICWPALWFQPHCHSSLSPSEEPSCTGPIFPGRERNNPCICSPPPSTQFLSQAFSCTIYLFHAQLAHGRCCNPEITTLGIHFSKVLFNSLWKEWISLPTHVIGTNIDHDLMLLTLSSPNVTCSETSLTLAQGRPGLSGVTVEWTPFHYGSSRLNPTTLFNLARCDAIVLAAAIICPWETITPKSM